MCTCDMFPAEHPDGYTDSVTYCEMLLRPGPRLSPHLFPGTVPTEPEASRVSVE